MSRMKVLISDDNNIHTAAIIIDQLLQNRQAHNAFKINSISFLHWISYNTRQPDEPFTSFLHWITQTI
jgi:hypothetical protein